ncbi:MAG: glycosyltransferase family 2 protein [Candidatus Edwardsbacteria bacterium]|nr:glycosyltransferase family 2 protein [Candidatus Edwardsbacteria bacterium]MBU1576896.1 glycosyltransferase family 2 protein [Candidatus Edwardsbacteria bacterium]MBU2463698.1 glycosyltransferase family 2 protein [Candidatus Edwardsbacteria bacterium]MBU2594257.1 glycosyltransferase family 2 protein [Candidatus Edwardsbacteria bacterium]
MTKTPKISIIIVTWNSGNEILTCLDSVYAQNYVSCEVIVIDNASEDNTVDLINNYGRNILLISNTRNLGFAQATNQGLDRAAGNYILLLNPDTILQPDSLKILESFMDSNPTVGALGPQLLNADDTIQPSCREFPRPVHFIWEFTGLARLFPGHPVFGSWRMGYFDHQSQREVDQPMGACLLVRKATVDQIGPMDSKRFPMFLNEVDWCFRLKRAGWKIFFLPQSRLTHLQGVSIKKARLAMTVSSHRSLAAFFDKHYPGRLSTCLVKSLLLTTLPFRLLFQALSKSEKRRSK